MKILQLEYHPLGSAPLCDVFGAIATIVDSAIDMSATLGSAAINKEAVEETNEANKEIAENTNAANIEMTSQTNSTNLQIQQMANDLLISESEKAYERSTPTNQIAELLRAGFSMQQAKQIVGGSGSPAMYQPASVGAAQMVAPHADPYTLQAPQVDASAIGNSFGRLGGSIAQFATDFGVPDGGATGAIIGSSAINFINENAAEIDELSGHSVNTFLDFENWAKNSGNQKYVDFVDSKEWKRCKRYLPATNAINSNMSKIFAANHTTGQEIELRGEQIKNASIKNRIDTVLAEVKENGKALEFLNQDLETKRTQYQLDNVGIFMEADLQTALSSIAECKLNSKVKGNPQYVADTLKVALQEQKTQLLVSQVLELQNQINHSGYQSLSDAQKSMLGVLSCFQDFGLTSADWATALAYAEANGVPIIQRLREFAVNLGWISQSEDGTIVPSDTSAWERLRLQRERKGKQKEIDSSEQSKLISPDKPYVVGVDGHGKRVRAENVLTVSELSNQLDVIDDKVKNYKPHMPNIGKYYH